MPSNETRTIVGFKIDSGSVSAAVQANQAVAQSYVSIADQIAALGLTGQQVFTAGGEEITASLVVPMDTASAAVKNVIRDLGTLKSEIASMPEPSLGSIVPGLGEAATTGGSGISTQQIGSRIAGLGGLVGSSGGQGFRDVSQLVMLGAVMGPLGVSAGIAALALKGVTDWEQQAADAGKEYVASLQAVAGEIAQGATSKDLQKSIDQKKIEQQVAQESQDKLELIRSEFLALINNVAYGSDEYNSVLKLLNAELYDVTGGASGLKDGLGKVSIGADVLDSALSQGQQAINAATGAIAFLNTEMGTQAVKANDAAAAIAQVGKQFAGFFGGSIGITAQGFDLGSIVGDFFKDRSAIVSAQTSDYFALLQKEAATQQSIYEIQSQEADARLAENVREQAIVADGAERRAQIIQDEQDNVARIIRDASREQAADVRARNVDAFLTSKTHEKDATDDQAKALGKQLTQQQRAQDKQIASQRAALATQVATLDRSLQAQQTILAQEKFAETSIALAGSQDLRVIHSDFWQDVNTIAVTFAANTVNTVRSIFGQQLSSGTPNSPLTKAVANIFDARFMEIYSK